MDGTTIVGFNLDDDPLGPLIGQYRPIRQIGEGGMGVVFLAQQVHPIRRDVAIKIIKPGMDSKQVIARFETERQALALMDHPNIARVFDADTTPQGRPYFVMELVDGAPITRYCDSKALSVKERIELFIPVCEAIQHAHQKGIIHRDIKPSNVLVVEHEGKAAPKVIDFGLAKALGQQLSDASMVSNIGLVVGTPEYMSPEQAELTRHDIDTRSDVYSLGVVLYELLTGTTPLKEAIKESSYVDLLQRVREEDSERPSSRLRHTTTSPETATRRRSDPARLPKLIAGELDWITMKALEKDRTRRYETANALVRDLQRYLEEEPVEAGPPSTTYRLRKIVRKHRVWLATAAAFAALLLTGIVVSSWLAYVARKENARAERNLQLAQNAVDEMLSSAGHQSARIAGDVPQMEEFRKELLDKARRFYATFTSQKPDSEKLRQELARAHFRLADIYRLLEQPANGVKEYEEAISEFQGLADDYPPREEYRQALANAYNWLGETLRTQPDSAMAADNAYAKAVDLQQDLVQASPQNAEYQRELGRTHYNRGILRYSIANFKDSESDFRAAIERLQPLADKQPDSGATQELARAYNNLATLLRRNNRLDEAKDLYERAIRLHRSLAERGPDNREYKQELATYNNNLAMLFVDEDRLDEAEQKNRDALSLVLDLASPAFSLGIEVANVHNLRCQILASTRPADALAECQRSLDSLNQLAKTESSRDRPELERLFRDLAYNYVEVAGHSIESGSRAVALNALDSLSRVLPRTTDADRARLSESYRELTRNLKGTPTR